MWSDVYVWACAVFAKKDNQRLKNLTPMAINTHEPLVHDVRWEVVLDNCGWSLLDSQPGSCDPGLCSPAGERGREREGGGGGGGGGRRMKKRTVRDGVHVVQKPQPLSSLGTCNSVTPERRCAIYTLLMMAKHQKQLYRVAHFFSGVCVCYHGT